MCATELFNLLAIYAGILNCKTSLQCIYQDRQIQTETWVFAKNLPSVKI